MNRTGKMLAATVAGLAVIKILAPGAVAQFFAVDKSIALFALAIAVIAYGVWLGPLRFLSGSTFTRLCGFIVLAAGIATISSPTLVGLRSTYLPVTDIFLIVESGIILQLVGLERKQVVSLSPMVVISLITQLMVRRLGRSPTPVSATR